MARYGGAGRVRQLAVCILAVALLIPQGCVMLTANMPVVRSDAPNPPDGFTGRWITHETHSYREKPVQYVVEYTVTNGVRNGPYSQKTESGWLELEGNYKNGLRDGQEIWHSRDGGQTIHHFRDGQLHGERLYIAPDGRKRQMITYRRGKRDGLQIEWFRDGGVAARGINKDDKPWSGEFQVQVQGFLCKHHCGLKGNITYRDGTPIPRDAIVEWDRNDNVVSRGVARNPNGYGGGTPWQGFFYSNDGEGRITTKYYEQGRLVREEPKPPANTVEKMRDAEKK